MTLTAPPPPTPARADPLGQLLDDRVAVVLDLHLHPRHGSAFWLDRAARLGLTGQSLRTLDDLWRLGGVTSEDLHAWRLWDYVPRGLHRHRDRMIIGQTGGTTGPGTWTAYTADEFNQAFITPFVHAAAAVGFSRGEPWLFVGPTGPHIIGHAVLGLAAAMQSPRPFAVDLDPRWARKLAGGSLAAARYMAHVIDQAMQVLDTQDVGVLFTTPPVLAALAARMSPAQRQRIRGIHYGGVALAPDILRCFQQELFPAAVHLSGYGNTLFGCALELSTEVGRPLDYFPHGRRLLLEIVDEHHNPVPQGQSGRLRFTRLDHSMLIIRHLERDHAQSILPSADAPAGFDLPGVRNPHTRAAAAAATAAGIY